MPARSLDSPLRKGELKTNSFSALQSPAGFCKETLPSAPHAVTTTKGLFIAVRSIPSQGNRPLWVYSTVLLQLPHLRHYVSQQQVHLKSLTRSWQEGALSSTFHMRKSRHSAGISGCPSPSPRHMHSVLSGWGGGVWWCRREEDGFHKDAD